ALKCCLLFTVKTLLLCKLCPVSLTLIGVFIATVLSDKCRNEAPKSALHFGPGWYRLYWNWFHIGTSSRYPTLVMGNSTELDLVSPIPIVNKTKPTFPILSMYY